jgi:bifunctional DNase/RNase
MPEMVEMMIDSVRVSLTNQQRIILLRELGGEIFLPIWVGPYEAEAITIALQEIEIARPQTHDLLISVFSHLNARLSRVEVTELRGDVFYGNLVVEVNGMQLNIDTRPSDAIALAVRAHAPIFVSKTILLEAGISPEKEVKPETKKPEITPGSEDEPGSDAPGSKERLSVFEDFLQNIDLDDMAKGTGDEESPDQPQDEPPDSGEPPKKKK